MRFFGAFPDWRRTFFDAMEGMIISFFGHATFLRTEEIEKRLLSVLQDQVGDAPCEFFLGGYGGFDEFARTCCEKYKKEHPNVRLVFVTPYITPEYQRNQLDYRKDSYDEIVYPPIEDKPYRFAISYRNQWMVQQADLVITFVQSSFGGAYQSYCYAKRRNKTIINLGTLDR